MVSNTQIKCDNNFKQFEVTDDYLIHWFNSHNCEVKGDIDTIIKAFECFISNASSYDLDIRVTDGTMMFLEQFSDKFDNNVTKLFNDSVERRKAWIRRVPQNGEREHWEDFSYPHDDELYPDYFGMGLYGNGEVILCDTRQKKDKNSHITEQLEELGYNVVRSKLYCGDYTWATNQQICIDTKQNLSEVVNNVVHDHERFKNECIRAQEAGIQLIILVTEPKVTCLADVFGWYNPRLRYNKKATTGRTLGKILYSMQSRYDVIFEFCTKDNVGKRIVELLGGQT